MINFNEEREKKWVERKEEMRRKERNNIKKSEYTRVHYTNKIV